MQIASCRTYHGKTVGHTLLRMPDGRSVFKIYYISVIGRDKPEDRKSTRLNSSHDV
jgi:hypothetical protein